MAKRKTNKVVIDVGDHIFYKWKGYDTIRHKGNTGKQAPIAKKQASILGKASALSARIRAAFEPILSPPLERKVLNRFNNAIQQWLRLEQIAETRPVDNIPFITGFSFYGGEALIGYLSHFSVNRTVAAGLALHITDFDPSGCPGILSSGGKARLHIIVTSCNVNDPMDNRSEELITDIPYTAVNFPGQVLSLPLQTSPGFITLVAFSTNRRNVSIAGAVYN